jgi:hypothetical protein
VYLFTQRQRWAVIEPEVAYTQKAQKPKHANHESDGREEIFHRSPFFLCRSAKATMAAMPSNSTNSTVPAIDNSVVGGAGRFG